MIDHLVLATSDVEGTAAGIAADWGLQMTPGGSHVGRGTRNELTGLGDGAYLEVVGPDGDQPEPPFPRPFGVDDLASAALVAWCARPRRPIDEVIAACDALGVHLGEAAEMSRARPDGVLLEWRLTFPLLGPPHLGTVPFLIDWQASPHPALSLPHHCSLRTLTLTTPFVGLVGDVLDAIGSDDRIVVAEGPAGLAAVIDTPAGQRHL